MADEYQLAVFGSDALDEDGATYQDPIHALKWVADHFKEKGEFGNMHVIECCLIRDGASGIVQWTLEIK
jgi:hypothetical protein